MPQLLIHDAEARRAVATELDAQQREARAQVRSKGRTFLERARLQLLSPFQRAKSWEPLRGRNPTFAVGRGQREAFFDAVLVVRAFRQAYRNALQAWRGGVRDVRFPGETWLMRYLHGAATGP